MPEPAYHLDLRRVARGLQDPHDPSQCLRRHHGESMDDWHGFTANYYRDNPWYSINNSRLSFDSYRIHSDDTSENHDEVHGAGAMSGLWLPAERDVAYLRDSIPRLSLFLRCRR